VLPFPKPHVGNVTQSIHVVIVTFVTIASAGHIRLGRDPRQQIASPYGPPRGVSMSFALSASAMPRNAIGLELRNVVG
jgi:hypothetical protein